MRNGRALFAPPVDGGPFAAVRAGLAAFAGGSAAQQLRWLIAPLALAAINLVSGKLALLLATPPGYATPVFPPAGIALAAVLAFGPRLLPGVFLGSLGLNLLIAGPAFGLTAALAAAAIAAGSTLQAWSGAWLVRRIVGYPQPLDTPRSIALTLCLGGPVAGLIAATCGVASLWTAGIVPGQALSFNWFAWWIGDTLGVLVFTPLVLVFVGRPRATWRERRIVLAVPLTLVFTLAVGVFWLAERSENRRIVLEFENQAHALANDLVHRIGNEYPGLVSAIASLYDSSETVTRREFAAFVARALEQHRGIQALEWIARVPGAERRAHEAATRAEARQARDPALREALARFHIRQRGAAGRLARASERDEHYPVQYVEPLRGNARALGFDLASDPAAREALAQARDTGRAAATGALELVQGTARHRGFLLFVPVYRDAVKPREVDERRRELEGFALGVFHVGDIVDATIPELAARGISVRVEDVSAGADQRLFYSTGEVLDTGVAYTRDFTVGERNWRLTFTASETHLASRHGYVPYMALAGGVLFAALVGGFLLLVTGHTAELHARTQALERSNRELDQFAYVASHDLKAPLRAIKQLAGWIVEDHGERLPDEAKRHLALLNGRAQRMEGLLEGLLQYSRARHSLSAPDSVEVPALVHEVIDTVSPPAGFTITVSGGPCRFLGHRVPLSQVLHNLLVNAVEHHDRDAGRIHVSCQDAGDHLTFSVRDDGPGIPPEHHERVFEIFQTLRSRDEAEFSGMGLAIVKRVLETHGGSIRVESPAERGAVFHFTWPKG